MYTLVKMFNFRELPANIQENLLAGGFFRSENVEIYNIGLFVSEVNGAHNKHDYALRSYTAMKEVDAWFIGQGAENDEEVVILR